MIKEFGKIAGAILYCAYLAVLTTIQFAGVIFFFCLVLSMLFSALPKDVMYQVSESTVKEVHILGIKCVFVIISGFISLLGLKYIAVKYKKWFK